MSTHEGVSCDNCALSNFSGKRYKCLICYDFDLCSSCYENSLINVSKNQVANDKSNSSTKQFKTNNNISTSSYNNNQNKHLNTHAMQCILTKTDQELFYGNNNNSICEFGIGTLNSIGEQSSFTCPYCSKFGFSETTLCEHLTKDHANFTNIKSSDDKNSTSNNGAKDSLLIKEVVCPICAVLPSSNGGDPNHLTDNLLQHINLEHSNHSNGNLDDNFNGILIGNVGGVGTLSYNSSNAAAAALRFSRRLNYSQNSSRSSLANNSNLSVSGMNIRNASNNNTNNSSINRYAFQLSNNGPSNVSNSGLTVVSGNTLSSFMRSTSANIGINSNSGFDSLSQPGAIDPIAELLSQLTGVRRAATSAQSTNLQLQQLQAQLNRERESLQQQSAVIAATSSSSSSFRNQHHNNHHLHHHLFGGGVGAKSQLLNSLTSSKLALTSNNQQGSSNPNATAIQAVQTANNITSAFTNQILELPQNYFLNPIANHGRDSRFLLSKYDFNHADNQNQITNLMNQSFYINDILQNLFIKQLDLNFIENNNVKKEGKEDLEQQFVQNNSIILETGIANVETPRN